MNTTATTAVSYFNHPGLGHRCTLGCQFRRGLGCMRKGDAQPWATKQGGQIIACGCNLQSSPAPRGTKAWK